MGRRVFYAEPKQPGEQSVHSVDFGPAMLLAGEKVASDNSVSVTVRERESAADVTASMFLGVTVSNNVATVQLQGGSDNYDYVATLEARTTLRPSKGEEADLIVPVRSRPRRTFAPVGP